MDPGPLFEAIQAKTNPELLWTDRMMLERLLEAADAPKDVAAWVLELVPDKPGVNLEAAVE